MGILTFENLNPSNANKYFQINFYFFDFIHIGPLPGACVVALLDVILGIQAKSHPRNPG